LKTRLDKLSGVVLEIAQGDPVEELLDNTEKPFGVGPVRPLGMSASPVEPKFYQVLVGFGLSGGSEGGEGGRRHRHQPEVRVLGRMQDNAPSRE
jgi:hypothetical protein